MATTPTTIRQLRRTVRELQDLVNDAEARANALGVKLHGEQMAAAETQRGLLSQIAMLQQEVGRQAQLVARREGYIDRVREVDGRQKTDPGLSADAVDKLREHLTACPEEEASKILDVISEDLKRRVTGLPDPVRSPGEFKFHAGDTSRWSRVG